MARFSYPTISRGLHLSREIFKKHTSCQFHQCFTCAFCIQNFGTKNYKAVQNSFVQNFSAKNELSYKKLVQKTLMKLSPVGFKVSIKKDSGRNLNKAYVFFFFNFWIILQKQEQIFKRKYISSAIRSNENSWQEWTDLSWKFHSVKWQPFLHYLQIVAFVNFTFQLIYYF